MLATGTIRRQDRSATGRFARDVLRASLICGLALVLCVAAAFVATRSPASISTTPRSHQPGEAYLSTGSMLVVTPVGQFCRERTIDSRTWLIRNRGWVNCAEALAKATQVTEGQWSGSRVDIIREGFRHGP